MRGTMRGTMRGMMRNESKNVMAALLLAATILAAPGHAAERPSRGVHEAGPARSWIVRVLSILGFPKGLGSIWEADSAYIDPNGQPTLQSGGGSGASASSDSSAYIDPNG